MRRLLFLYPGRSRQERLAQIDSGSVPRDFYYGLLSMRDSGWDASIGDTRKDPTGRWRKLLLQLESLRSRCLRFGYYHQRVTALAEDLATCDQAISFTDGFSVALGLYGPRLRHGRRPLLLGGFHGLTDIVAEANPLFRWFVAAKVRAGLAGLDHVFFFGEADRRKAIRCYGVPEAKTSLFRFGVDVDFWRPDAKANLGTDVVAVGSDPKRDYDTLVRAPITAPIKLLTRLPVDIPAGKTNIALIEGSYHNAAVSDEGLRQLYCQAAVIAVPLRDVNQPTGYSVTLQAMACGKPVVLSRIKGLWDPEMFVSGDNCMLVPPGDAEAFGVAVETLMNDPDLRRRMGVRARETAERHFSLARMDADIDALARRMEAENGEPT